MLRKNINSDDLAITKSEQSERICSGKVALRTFSMEK